ncbi:MAG TPA: cupin domain-containing protein [Lacunisphaera sp.]|nr:cupin domain-containing protein [Lacunisphaera sp.]
MKIPCSRFLPVMASAMALSFARGAEGVPPATLPSTVFTWESLGVKSSGVGERRDVARNPTATLREFECHISTLNPNLASHPPHTHPQEELIILRDGELDVHINGVNTRVGPGSLFFFAANDPHAVRNPGDKPATYFVFNFSSAITDTLRGKAPLPADQGRLGSAIFHWEQLKYETTKAGGRRSVVDLPTATLANYECHVTTINAGLAPHAPHHHADEEIVLVKEGELDVTINGTTTRAGAGSIVFVSSGDEHGWKNAGTGPATYYVMRLKTAATPATVAAR